MSIKKNQIVELLAPAGNFEKLVSAVHYGADAVYVGGRRFSLRAKATNFDNQGLINATDYVHEHGVKIYVTVNIFARNNDLDDLRDYLLFLREAGVDGLIIADPGVVLIARENVPELPIHLSTQANITNKASVRFWTSQGIKRLNLARELSLEEIKEIRKETRKELEVFVHGALCISYSGRCLLSTYMTGRDGNRGDCAHPCRYSYQLIEEKRPGHLFPVEEDEYGTYIFNSRDLCLLARLPELIAAGVDSIKIEGRMKSSGYVGTVVRLYRAAIDWIKLQLKQGYPLSECVLPTYFLDEVERIGTRGWTENFINGQPGPDAMLHGRTRLEQSWAPVAVVLKPHPLFIEVRNVLKQDDTIEYLGRNLDTISVTVKSIRTEEGDYIQRANPGNRVFITTQPQLFKPETNAICRINLKP